jgi:hypothetical protein
VLIQTFLITYACTFFGFLKSVFGSNFSDSIPYKAQAVVVLSEAFSHIVSIIERDEGRYYGGIVTHRERVDLRHEDRKDKIK